MKLLAVALWLLLLVGAYRRGAEHSSGVRPAPSGVASFESALDQRDQLARSYGVSRFLRGLDASNLDAAREVAAAAGFWFEHQDYRLLMAGWVPIDADAAVDWAFARPAGLRNRATSAAFEALGFNDPPRAQYFLGSIDSPSLLDALHLSMVEGWARSDRKDELVAYLTDLPPSVSRQRATRALAKEILKRGPDELIAWVDMIEPDPDNAFKRVAFQKSASVLAEIDPARAARWVEEHLGRPYAAQTVDIVAQHWAQSDPEATLNWLVSLPEPSGEADWAKIVFTRWVARETRAAEAWVRSAAPSKPVDPLVRVLIRRYFDRDPAISMEWAHLIADPVVRTRVLTSAGRGWFRTAREAFMAWLPKSGLEIQVRDLILNTPTLEERKAALQGEQESEALRP